KGEMEKGTLPLAKGEMEKGTLPLSKGEMEGVKPASRSGITPFYERWQRQMPAEFEATAEDAAYATLLFASGVVGQYIEEHAAHGKGLWQRIIYGSKGTLELPSDRSGSPIALTLDSGETINDGRILDFVPDFHLDDVTARLFGGERLWRYDLSFAETDRKIIAIEYADFADAILNNRPPEVDAAQGARAVAVCYAMLESGATGQVVRVDDVLNESVAKYQQEINESLGLA
ncbi:MAG: Gfo/Idh/MocA family oxidoreductase, partial [Abditibacteriales bacterium]|nr:Gfo/Idh/MocA family oxidoreductase [Abditibacteriales bacterium]